MSTGIEWTDETWNPIRAVRPLPEASNEERSTTGVGWHCERVSPGCQNCYAETLNEAQRWNRGTGLGYNRQSRDAVDIYLDEDTLTKPLHWRKPRRVFVCSMTDLFGEWVSDETIDRVFAVMALTPQHTYQVLTKRPQRMREYLSARPRVCERVFDVMLERPDELGEAIVRAWHKWQNLQEDVKELALQLQDGWIWPLPNVWLGVSVENQQRADERIPVLLDTPAAVRFLSCEPLLGPVDISAPVSYRYAPHEPEGGYFGSMLPRLNWVIIGGESGPGARPCDVGWIRDIVRQCQAEGVAAFVKQGSGPRPGMSTGDPEWDAIKEFPDA